jgi:microcin C transport system ATP-binding protein
MTLLTVSGLKVAFGAREVVHGASFTLERGETLALVGESGSGKSVTALSLLQLLPPEARSSGGILLDGVEVLGAPERRLREIRGRRAGIVFQEPMTSLNPLHKVGRQVGEAIALHRKLSPGALRARVVEVLTQAGFADAAQRLDAYPHQLSGGQRQRVMIAMAIANDPALLIADEPTTALDVTIQAQILETLRAMQRARGLALLLITHDLTIVERFADRVCVMKDGDIVEAGSCAEVFARPRHEYTRKLLDAAPKGPAAALPADPAPLMTIENMRVYFPVRRGVLQRVVDHIRAVDGLSLTVHEGETVALVGESGSGKSTTGFASLGLQAAEGRVTFQGADLATLDGRALRRLRARMQIVFQDPFGSLSPRLSVGEIIAEGLEVHEPSLRRADRDHRVAEALREVGLTAEAAARYPHEFSGGQRQRVSIARAMVVKPRYVVLDEPTSALDLSVQAQVVGLLRRLQQVHGLGYLFISHDLRVVRAIAHRVVVMRQGKVVEDGPAEQIFAAPREAYTKALLAAAFDLAVAG